MPIRDLGYRPYEGKRLPPSNNTWVMLRHGLGRAWGSWLVKVSGFLCWVPPLIMGAYIGIHYMAANSMDRMGNGQMRGVVEPLDGGDLLHSLYGWQLWIFGLMISLGAGASAISEDFTHRAFQFYFAKPVTPQQYLLGRVMAVGIWIFSILFVPGFLVTMLLVGTATPDARLENLGLMLPALLHALLVSATIAIGAVGVSSLSKSRALTMSAWILLFLVPWVLATIVDAVGEWPWLKLVSLPALLSVMGDTLFKVTREDALRWYHALPILVAFIAGSLQMARMRLRGAEVIT